MPEGSIETGAIMKKKYLAVMIAAIMIFNLTGCGSSESSTGGNTATSQSDVSSQEEGTVSNSDSTAIPMQTTGNPAAFHLNNPEGVLDPSDGSSWVKIATIWDEELTVYSADSFAQNSVAIAVTFDVTGLDKKSQKCYWNYQVLDADGKEIQCWDDSYKTDEITITEDGTYQMVYDYSKVTDDGVLTGLQSLQLVFPKMSESTTTVVTLTDAVCIMDKSEIGDIYQSGKK